MFLVNNGAPGNASVLELRRFADKGILLEVVITLKQQKGSRQLADTQH
jgi:hypothetical protein